MTRDEILKLKLGDPVIHLVGDYSHPQIIQLDKDPWCISYDELGLYYPATIAGVEEWKSGELLSLDRQLSLPKESCFGRMSKERYDGSVACVKEIADDLIKCVNAMTNANQNPIT